MSVAEIMHLIERTAAALHAAISDRDTKGVWHLSEALRNLRHLLVEADYRESQQAITADTDS